jgi:hypothetical protein
MPEFRAMAPIYRDGTLAPLRPVPNAVIAAHSGIDNAGQVTGAAGRMHGFLLSNGRFKTLDVPGRSGTLAIDVNDRSEVVIPDPNTSLGPVAGIDDMVGYLARQVDDESHREVIGPLLARSGASRLIIHSGRTVGG